MQTDNPINLTTIVSSWQSVNQLTSPVCRRILLRSGGKIVAKMLNAAQGAPETRVLVPSKKYDLWESQFQFLEKLLCFFLNVFKFDS